MSEMFCFQCEQTANGTGCKYAGVCGKSAATSNAQDELTCALIALANAANKAGRSKKTDSLIVDGLFMTVTNVNFDTTRINQFKDEAIAEKNRLAEEIPVPAAKSLFDGDKDIVSLRSTLLFGMRGMAAYAHHAGVLGLFDDEVNAWFYKGLPALLTEHSVDEWLSAL